MTQSLQPFPLGGTPLVDEERLLAHPWHRFFITLWQKTGSTLATVAQTLFLQQISAGPIEIVNAASGTVVGTLATTGQAGGPQVVQVLGSSPFTYTAQVGSSGSLTVESGKVEISRQGSPYYPVSLTGGQFKLLSGDSARVTWYQAKPVVVYFPDGLV